LQFSLPRPTYVRQARNQMPLPFCLCRPSIAESDAFTILSFAVHQSRNQMPLPFYPLSSVNLGIRCLYLSYLDRNSITEFIYFSPLDTQPPLVLLFISDIKQRFTSHPRQQDASKGPARLKGKYFGKRRLNTYAGTDYLKWIEQSIHFCFLSELAFV